jgi:hypothetical protein
VLGGDAVNATFLHQLFPYLPPSDWVSIVRTSKHTARNSNLIQQQIFSARFHIPVAIPPKVLPGAIYAFHKQFAQNPAANTWALKTGTSIRFFFPKLTQCILLPGPLVAGLSGKTLEIRSAQNTRIDQILFKHEIALLAGSRDGKMIAAGSFRNGISVHSLADKQVQTIAKSNLSDLVKTYGTLSLESLAFFPDGRLFTAYHTQTTGIVIVWNLKPEKRGQPILIQNFRLEDARLSPSGRTFVAQGTEIDTESPRSFEKDQPLSTPKAKVLKVVFWHYNFKRQTHTVIVPPGSVKPKQFAVVSDEALVAAEETRLIWMKATEKTGKKIEALDDGYEITNLCLGTNGLLHATTQWSLNTPTLTRNQFRTYDLSTYKRISSLRIHPLPAETSRTLFLSSTPGAVAFATGQNGHADLITFGSVTPTTTSSSSSSSSSSSAAEIIDLADDSPPLPEALHLFLSPPTPSQPSVPLASPKALPKNTQPKPPSHKRQYPPLALSAASSSSSSSSSAKPASPPAKQRKLNLVQK